MLSFSPRWRLAELRVCPRLSWSDTEQRGNNRKIKFIRRPISVTAGKLKYFNDLRMNMFIWAVFFSFICPPVWRGPQQCQEAACHTSALLPEPFPKKTGIQTRKSSACAMFPDFMMMINVNSVYCDVASFKRRNLLVCSSELECSAEFCACL